jgi:condensin complex subunit 3
VISHGSRADDQKRPVADAASRNAIVRFEGAIQKRFPDQLEGYNQDTFRAQENEEVVELFGFIDDVYVDC